MNRFLDTCAIIGYCFPTDDFHPRCQDIIQIRKLWTSDHVIREWNNKKAIKECEHSAALLEHIEYINENYSDIITEESKNDLIAYSPIELKGFINVFYEQTNFPTSVNELCDRLNNIAMDLNDARRRRYTELKSKWNGNVYCRMKEYPVEEKNLGPYAHEEDICILIDAHDLSIKLSPKSLKFLTTDDRIWQNKGKIRSILNINDIIDLKRESALM